MQCFVVDVASNQHDLGCFINMRLQQCSIRVYCCFGIANTWAQPISTPNDVET